MQHFFIERRYVVDSFLHHYDLLNESTDFMILASSDRVKEESRRVVGEKRRGKGQAVTQIATTS